MNISKAQTGTSGLISAEKDETVVYSKFAFYGIHTLKFVDRLNNAIHSPAPLSGVPAGAAPESGVEVRLAPGTPGTMR